ncbi:hypothetical protein C8J57DRAFT_739328 [Mycena rebaudengoi]|jgi:RNase P subunit RPR2|nr:hypothetical protein C8J57DRAFT_739328 [Mycena rebaudengoi]
MDPDAATTKFQLALPISLLSVSPSLSALHSIRVQRPSSESHSCRQCGIALHRGESSIRSIRPKADPSSRALRTTCLACGWVQTVPVGRGNAALFPRTRSGTNGRIDKNVYEAIATPVVKPSALQATKPPMPQSREPSSAPLTQPSTPSVSTSPAPPKSRPKKKGGLQSMLARNRERESREAQEKQQGKGAGGLAMFLNNL